MQEEIFENYKLGDIVTSMIFLLPQSVLIDEDLFKHEGLINKLVNSDQLKDIPEAVNRDPVKTLEKIARTVIDNTPAHNTSFWQKFVEKADESKDHRLIYSLSSCIEEGLVTCFHRAVVYSLLCHQFDTEIIRCSVIQDSWHQGEDRDFHLWNFVHLPKNKASYLVDCSLLNIDLSPIIEKSEDYKNGKKIILKNGNERVYYPGSRVILERDIV